MTAATYIVIVMLTFSDGSYVQYNDGKWVTAKDFEACTTEIQKEIAEMREIYKDSTPKPSTFITGCALKEAP